MMDSPDDVTVAKALKTPKIVFTPKQKMRDAANEVQLSVDRVKPVDVPGVTPTPGGEEEGGEETDDPLA